MKLTQQQRKRYEWIKTELTKLVDDPNCKIESFKVTPLGNGPNFFIVVCGSEPCDLVGRISSLEKLVWIEGHGIFRQEDTMLPGLLLRI